MKRWTGLRVGVVGCGYRGSKHVRALSAIDAVEKLVVIDLSRPWLDALERLPTVELAARRVLSLPICPYLPMEKVERVATALTRIASSEARE